MEQCPQMERVASLVGEELVPYQRADVISHIQRCPECRLQIARMSWLARTLPASRNGEPPPDTPHLTDLEVAAFATNSLPAEQAQYLEAHLARCEECARLLASVRKALDEYEEVFGKPERPPSRESRWRRVRQDLRIAFSTRRTAAAMLGALLLYLGECACFALAVGHVLLACLPWPPSYDGLPDFWPLWLIEQGPWRLATFAGGCILIAVVLRVFAGKLYRAACRARARTAPNR